MYTVTIYTTELHEGTLAYRKKLQLHVKIYKHIESHIVKHCKQISFQFFLESVSILCRADVVWELIDFISWDRRPGLGRLAHQTAVCRCVARIDCRY